LPKSDQACGLIDRVNFINVSRQFEVPLGAQIGSPCRGLARWDFRTLESPSGKFLEKHYLSEKSPTEIADIVFSI
jgi:hypothetical protein